MRPLRPSPRMLIAQQMVRRTLGALPDELRQAALECSIELMDMADCGADEGLDEELLGLFEGCSRLDGSPESPDQWPHIRLFLDNLWDYSERDVATYRDEVKTTLLHELGHYLGLDEADLEARIGLKTLVAFVFSEAKPWMNEWRLQMFFEFPASLAPLYLQPIFA